MGNRRTSAASISLEVEGVGVGGGSACQCSDHTLHTASNCSALLSFQKELNCCRTSSKDDAQENPQKQSAEDKQIKDMDYWNHVMWSDETKKKMYLVQMVSKCVWR